MADALTLIDEWGPEKIVTVSHRRSGMKGVLVIDNTARGMGKGGTRMSSTVTVGEVARLARNMTWKWSVVDLFYGGAKAGIAADPTAPDKEAILRAFARALHNEVPSEYVFGLDVGLTEDDAAVIQDELGSRAAAVGTPAHLGGVAYDRLGITGFGVAEAADAAAEYIGLAMSGARVSIQGFGAVGQGVARRIAELGGTVVAVSTACGSRVDPGGFDVAELLRLHAQHGDNFIAHIATGAQHPVGAELTVDCEVLVPAAMQDVIVGPLATQVRARMIVEGANLPTSAAAQSILDNRGVVVVPDVVANAGGVIAAAFAMDVRHSAFPADTSQIFATVSEKLRHNAGEVLSAASSQRVTPHAAARRLAERRVLDAMRSKGRG
jgi:glutamate dehydrogenase (NAD(P)+)